MKKLLASILACATLAACGGGGGRPGECHGSPAVCFGTDGGSGGVQSDSIAGLYTGSTSTGLTIFAAVEDNSTFWLLYSLPGNPNAIAGAEQGTIAAAAGSMHSDNLVDLSLASGVVSLGTMSGTYRLKDSAQGLVSFLTQSVSFTATFRPGSDVPVAPGDAAGTYAGTAVVAGGSEGATVTVGATGDLTGVSNSGCRFDGQASPEQSVAAYHLTVTFRGGSCSNGTATVTGVAVLRDGALLSAALNSSRTNGFLFAGAKR